MINRLGGTGRWHASISRQVEPGSSPQGKAILLACVLLVGICFAVLIGRLWYMQILGGDHFRTLSENNRIRLIDIPPSRGLIFDIKGRLLADNRPTFTLAAIPEDVPDWGRLSQRLKNLVGITPQEVQKARKSARGQQPFKPIRLKSHLDRKQLAILETFRYELPGVRVLVEYRRAYHAATETAHVIGYLGEINKKELARASRVRYRLGDYVGRSGLEAARERVLHGKRGARQVEVDVMGRELAVLEQAQSQPGHNLILSINLDLQRAAAGALGDLAGAVVAMNPQNGQIYCMYSSPSFDQNTFITGMTGKQWKKLGNDPKHPLKNRALSGLYPPGSTYKIVTALAGLSEGVITPQTTFTCTGQIVFGRRAYACWAKKKGGHGVVALHKALRESCDVYFYRVGLRVGVDRLAKWARVLGLGIPTGLKLSHESPGLIPTSKWKLRRFGEPWQEGETLSIAIGQGFDLVTPIQLARMVSVVANGGWLVTPTVVKAVVPSGGGDPVPEPPGLKSRVDIKPENLALVKSGLEAVVNEPHGTARRVALPGIRVGGKTGTAQVVALKFEKSFGKADKVPWKYRSHALFVAFAPAEDPTIAVAVVVEHGGHGGSRAGPVAKAVLKAFFGIKDPRAKARKTKAKKKPAPPARGREQGGGA